MGIRFHLDENVSSGIAAGLRRRNIDVTTTAEARLIGATDQSQLEFAAASGRVLVTQDDDFLRLHTEGASSRRHRLLQATIDVRWRNTPSRDFDP